MNFIILSTPKSKLYARKIAGSIAWQNKHRYPREYFNTKVVTTDEFNINILPANVANTIIHARAAYPNCDWMDTLVEIQERQLGKVVNTPEVLKLTSNKLACSLKLMEEFPHPVTWELNKKKLILPELYPDHFYILKPTTSVGQGKFVKKVKANEIIQEIDNIPGNRIVLQECVPYDSIWRVIVIGGKALPYSFVDRPTANKWKVSVCLNRVSMQCVSNPELRLLKLAEDIQKFIGGDINFIDIFGTRDGYAISEINTACSLLIHERLAKQAGCVNYNIHSQIAQFLIRKGLE